MEKPLVVENMCEVGKRGLESNHLVVTLELRCHTFVRDIFSGRHVGPAGTLKI